MPLVAFVSHRGAPGTTSLALAVAAAWPTSGPRHKVLVEADPAGGVLALRLGLAEDPGLVSLAAAARHGLGRTDLWDHAQALPGGLAVVPGPSSIAVASQLLATSAGGLGCWMAELGDVVVIADAGRLSPASEAGPLVRAADLVVAVAAPVADQLHPAAQQLTALRTSDTRVGWSLVGGGPYDASAIEEAYGIPVFGTIPDDARGASMLFSSSSSKRLSRTPLVRAATTLADHLAPWLESQRPDTGAAQRSVAAGGAAPVDSGPAGAMT